MTPEELEEFAVQLGRSVTEAHEVAEFVATLKLPPESLEAFVHATGELANLADRERAEPEPKSWLRMAERTAEKMGLRRAID